MSQPVINVVSADEIPPDTPVVPAAPGSVLASMRERRERISAKLYLDLKVPRWDDDGGPSVWVRYKPADIGKVNTAVEKRAADRKALGDDWSILAHADVLVDSCVGVYQMVDGEKRSLRDDDPGGEWTRFDADLGAAIGVDEARAAAVCRGLFFTSGDLEMQFQQLVDWSASASETAAEEFRGN